MNERTGMYESFDFPVFLHAKMKENGMNIKKLSDVSGIAIKHIDSLLRGEFRQLPAAPYLRGYIYTLAEILDFNAEEWWDRIRTETSVRTSGMQDAMPQNRFSPSRNMQKLIALIIAVFIIGVIAFRIPQIFGTPSITVFSPDKEAVTVFEEAFTIRGKVENGANQIFINNEQISLDKDGFWEKTVLLQLGLNTFTIKAQKFLGRSASASYSIVYEQPDIVPQHTTSTPTRVTTPNTVTSTATSTRKNP